jgi:membrane-associated protease RseP (regulator of RpoE activity)
VAERAGLRPGDTILEVNGTPFTSINHEEALKVITLFFYTNFNDTLCIIQVASESVKKAGLNFF